MIFLEIKRQQRKPLQDFPTSFKIASLLNYKQMSAILFPLSCTIPGPDTLRDNDRNAPS